MSGGNRGLGLEMALGLIEAGVRAVYCVDLAKEPSEEWQKVREYAAKMTNKGGEGRLEYISGNVTDQVRVYLGNAAEWLRAEPRCVYACVRVRRRPYGRSVKI